MDMHENDVWSREHDWARLLFHPIVAISVTVLYLVIVKGINIAMKDRPAFWPSATAEGQKKTLNPVAITYNLAQVILCTYMFYGLWVTPFSFTSPLSTFFRLNTNYTENAEYFIFVHYLSKWLDYFDTFIMALRKKQHQMSFLHLFHHASIPLVWSILLHFNYAYGTVTLGAFANSFVHMVMYSHYLVTCFGFVNPYKKWVTKIQLGQFLILIIHSLVALLFENKIPPHMSFIQLVYQFLMLWMFKNFFTKAYSKKVKKSN